jgi:heptosyltransferase-1
LQPSRGCWNKMRSNGISPQSILIIKLSAIGDVVQTLPMAEALRSHFPQARIDWLVEEEASDLLIGHPALDRVLISRRKKWQRDLFRGGLFLPTLGKIRRFFRELRQNRYDWVIDNHGILKSGLSLLAVRGRRKIGFRKSPGIADEGNYFFTRERFRPLNIERHALERYLDLIRQLGVKADPPDLRFPVPEECRRKVETLLRQDGLTRPVVVIHPLAKWPSKQWPAENFARLIDRLAGREIGVVLSGGPQDRAQLERIRERVSDRRRVMNWAGKTTLRELAALFSLADLVVTTDTGPMHLAAAVKAPLIALFGPTAPWRTGPYGDPGAVFRKPLSCSPCFKKKCDRMECMTTLTVDEVWESAVAKLPTSRVGS